MGQTAAIILAAGHGKRMRSAIPKVLHPVAGRPMIRWVIDAVEAAGAGPILVVLGPSGDEVTRALPPGVLPARQPTPLGTGDAVCHGVAGLPMDVSIEDVVVGYGDCPLLTGELFTHLIAARRESRAAIALSETVMDNPFGYGRIIRDGAGAILAVVEEAVASPEQRKLRGVNAGQYCFDRRWLEEALPRIEPTLGSEYPLTDLVELAARDGRRVVAVEAPAEVTSGVNDRAQLAWAAAIMRRRVCERLMRGGVTIVDPTTTYVDAEVEIGADTIIYPGTTLAGLTIVGERCQIGPNSYVVASRIGDDTRVLMSAIEHAQVERNVQIGPFSHLRPGARIESDVELGNYAEVKNSRLGAGSKMHHFSYLGDANVGTNVNVAAGTITCNFDVESGVKSRTVVGDDAALGSDTMLVAPVTVGAGAITGAGSVVTRDIEPETVVVGVPARPVRRRRRSS